MQECSPLQGTRGRGPGKMGCGIASPAAQALSPGHHEGSRPLPLRTHPGTCLPGCWSGRPADVTRRNMGWGRPGQAACRRGFQGLSAQSPRELTAAIVEVGPASLVKPPPTGGAPERVCTRGPGMGGACLACACADQACGPKAPAGRGESAKEGLSPPEEMPSLAASIL